MLFFVLISIIFFFTNVAWRPHIYRFVAYSLALFGFLNGYMTSRYLKFFGTTDMWFSVTISAVVLPMVLMTCLILEKLFDWANHIPNRTFSKVKMEHAFVAFLINACLCYFGA